MPVVNFKYTSRKLASVEAEVQNWNQLSDWCIKNFRKWDKKLREEQKIAKKEKNREEYKNLGDRIQYLREVFSRELGNIEKELKSAQKKEAWLRLILTGSRLRPEDQ
jgi:hypothetical protein